MTREEAIKEARKYGREVYATTAYSEKDGVKSYEYFSIHINDDLMASHCTSWAKCIEDIEKQNPEEIRQTKISKLKAELAKLEGEAA